MRVISICPSNTELLDYLGKIDHLIAVDDFSDYPDSVNKLPRLGPDLSIDMEKVAALEPDLVLASLSVPGMESNIKALEEKKLPFLVLNPNTLEEIAEDLRTVAEALGDKDLGDEKAGQFRQEVHFYEAAADKRSQRFSLYWEWWPKPIFTPGRKNWLTEISRLSGGWNIFETEDAASIQTDWEDVRKRNPEHICMVWVGVEEKKMRPELIRKRPGWENVDAVKKDNIHILPESLFCRPSPRLLVGLDKLEQVLKKNSSL
ncbi:cobalamin-binding protein [Sediminibacillus albus]|uniref:Iron complex transport system substrate-binding protein n=1 Tax=Sediminibacillus albus TaxID=407036 RepID=A0A1G8XGT5_9BACI|nr:cobalamin-binding protein [Sediminibacillus albus]SDJ89617.1 iron complex transport system substrate-binding protein [Sediminibacillus albus]